MKTTYTIAADGSCSGNPGPGGFAWALFGGDVLSPDTMIASGGGALPHTTNNVMEVSALEGGLKALLKLAPGEVKLHLDSEYALKGLTEWLPGWKRRKWMTAAKKPVANRELWERLDTLQTRLIKDGFVLRAAWVRGHTGDYANELVDALAVDFRDKARAA